MRLPRHNKIEDTKEEHLELCVTAFDKLAEKAMGWIKDVKSGHSK